MLKCIQTTYCIAGVRLLKRNGGLLTQPDQATLGLYALFADFFIVRAANARQRRRVQPGHAKPPVGPGHASARRPNRCPHHRRCQFPRLCRPIQDPRQRHAQCRLFTLGVLAEGQPALHRHRSPRTTQLVSGTGLPAAQSPGPLPGRRHRELPPHRPHRQRVAVFQP